MYRCIFRDLGKISYAEAWEYQEKLCREVITGKLEKRDYPATEEEGTYNYLLFCEHPHVFTLGKSGKVENLLISTDQLEAKQVTFYKTNRGGDITYHGPGQIVAYPILDLEWFRLGIHDYIHHLEETVILTLRKFDVRGERLKGSTGVWIDPTVQAKARKICAIGVRVSRGVTMHGLALNVNTDLSYFDLINPCGFTDKTVTSLEKETGMKQDMEQVGQILREKFCDVFGMEFTSL